LAINEFLPRAGFDWNQDGKIDVHDEFIEIINVSAADISMKNWRLDDEENAGSEPYVIPDGILKPGERIVFYGSKTNILLSDGGDTVRLLNPSGKVFDAYTYTVAKEEDVSWCRYRDGVGLLGPWHDSCVPTPGNANALKGRIPSTPQGTGLETPLCLLPDTLLPAYLLAECNGYGAGIWRPMFWDESGWLGRLPIYDNKSKWRSFVE
jgi:hypothetical protein